MKIYIVTSGCYSCRKCVGAYTSPELAERAKEQAGEYGEIIELDVDSLPKHEPGYKRWMVWMARDGTIQMPTEHISAFDYQEEFVNNWGSGGWTFSLWARDKKHAEGIANEKRAMLIAQPNVRDRRPSANDCNRD